MTKDLPFGNTLLSVWEEYRKAAKRSREFKSRLDRKRLFVLVCLVLGSILGVSADQSRDVPSIISFASWLPGSLAALSAIALGFAAFVAKETLSSASERKWVIARSQAEALKSEAYKFLVKAPPYDDSDADEKLAARSTELLDGDTSPTPVRLSDVDRRRNLPADWLSLPEYIEKRVRQQITEFYEPKAYETYRTVRTLQAVTIALGGIGVVLGGVGTLPDLTWTAGWIGVVGTISGAVAAFAFAGRYQYLATSYELTARRLTWAVNCWERLGEDEKETTASSFISECENAISVENHNWIAEWTTKKEG